MAFPWALIEGARLASGSLVEDMQLGLELARAGHAPMFCEQALVTSRFPDSAQASASQRARWEHGHLSLIGQQLPPLLVAAWRRRDPRLMAMALDLSVPPLALLVMLVAGLWLASALLAAASGGMVLWLAASLVLGLLALAVLAAWVGWGRSLLGPWDLLGLPWYVLSKLSLYRRFWSSRRQKDWVRTDRE
jgi:cellulose synthase/poly-beta-1,6-N-acetylglucosamine synthase-like glycosyltransferase